MEVGMPGKARRTDLSQSNAPQATHLDKQRGLRVTGAAKPERDMVMVVAEPEVKVGGRGLT
jgi:hypothetical protein